MENLDIVALGGNAILPAGGAGTIAEQLAVTGTAMVHAADLLAAGRRVVLTHGNGPIVGNIVVRNEAARDTIAPMPLDVCGADSQGGIGYMMQQTLRNELMRRGIERDVVAVVTQVVVASDDPAFGRPEKPIGPYYSEGEAKIVSAERGWEMVDLGTRGFRRVVASPRPIDIVEKNVIEKLVMAGTVVITVGGGGIPVVRSGGAYRGREAVVDKDLSSSLLGRQLGAERLIIVTDVEAVFQNYGTATQEPIRRVTLAEMDALNVHGQFPPGSMGSKIEAAIDFLKGGGDRVIITNPSHLAAALAGRAGTTIETGTSDADKDSVRKRLEDRADTTRSPH